MDQNFHLIEKYFQGKLDKDELQLFNQKLQQDPSFEQEFRDMKLIRDAVKETSRVRALDILQNAEANLINQETTKINVSMKRLVSIAASLIIVATVSYFAFSGSTGALTGEEIVANYYEAYPNLGGPVRGDAVDVTLSARAYNAYDIKDYSTSANLFAELLTSEKTVKNYFYSGIANLEAGNLDLAKSNLNTVMNNYSELNDQAQWYLAMALFKEGAENEALSNIASLAIGKSTYSANAKNVLKDLDWALSLDEGSGTVSTEEKFPDDNDSPDGANQEDGLRRWQKGTIMSLDNNAVYPFINDVPMEDLIIGDMVNFVVVNHRNGKRALAVITQNLH